MNEIENAASAHAKDLLDMCDSKNWVEMSGEDYKRTIKNTFLAGAEHAGAEFEKLTSDLIAQAACAREQGARRLAEYLVHKSEYPCCSVDDLMTIYRGLK